MLDQALGWFVIFAPFLLSAVFILIPAKAENPKAHIRWRWALFFFCVLFSGATAWQQRRAAKEAANSTTDAIALTSRTVTADVTRADESIISAQNQKINLLQASVDKQGGKMSVISQSNFITGAKPVQVHVTNQVAPEVNPSLLHSGHLTVTQTSEISTRSDTPARIRVVVQSDLVFPKLLLTLSCDQPIVSAEWNLEGARQFAQKYILLDPRTPTRYVIGYDSATPNFGPANPIYVDIYAQKNVSCLHVSSD